MWRDQWSTSWLGGFTCSLLSCCSTFEPLKVQINETGYLTDWLRWRLFFFLLLFHVLRWGQRSGQTLRVKPVNLGCFNNQNKGIVTQRCVQESLYHAHWIQRTQGVYKRAILLFHSFLILTSSSSDKSQESKLPNYLHVTSDFSFISPSGVKTLKSHNSYLVRNRFTASDDCEVSSCDHSRNIVCRL